MKRAAVILATILAVSHAEAQQRQPNMCVSLAEQKHTAEQKHIKWTELTPEQWQFVRGLFVLNPGTPPGMPFGDHAALLRMKGDSGGLVVFIDGDRACDPMALPAEALAMLKDVKDGTIRHAPSRADAAPSDGGDDSGSDDSGSDDSDSDTPMPHKQKM